MARFVREIMTSDPRTLERGAALTEAARIMKEDDVGAVIVTDGDSVFGLITDRDIVVRALAEGKSAEDTKVGDVASTDITALEPDDSIDDAIRQMRSQHIRRIPVVEDGKAKGILSIGDLALERDQESALAEISAAAGNN
jgi:CBS domain-containing protein